MAYSQAVKESCKHHYVHLSYSLEEIAETFDISLRSIKSWKTTERWDASKQALLEASDTLHENLYHAAIMVSDQISKDLDNKKDVDTHRLNAPQNLIKAAKLAIDYATAKANIQTKDDDKKELSGKDLIKQIDETLRG